MNATYRFLQVRGDHCSLLFGLHGFAVVREESASLKGTRIEQIMNQLLGISILAGSFGLFSSLITPYSFSDLKFNIVGAALLVIASLAYFTRLIIESIIKHGDWTADSDQNP